jgi:hypothetical protein
VLHHWGELHFCQRKWDEAEKIWTEVLKKSLALDFPKHIIGAYHGLGRVAQVQKNDKLSRRHHQNWQSMYDQMDVHEKKWIKYWLPDLPVEM